MLRVKKHRQKRDVLGFRLPMLTHEEQELDIADITIMDPDNTYYMRMGSDAMAGYHILKDHILVIDRTLKPVPGSIVVFFHEGEFYTREYLVQQDTLLLKADKQTDCIAINGEDRINSWACWGVVTVTLNPVIHPQLKVGRYGRVCAC